MWAGMYPLKWTPDSTCFKGGRHHAYAGRRFTLKTDDKIEIPMKIATKWYKLYLSIFFRSKVT